MVVDFSEIRRMRKYHNLTQGELAKLARVSQSLIAKMESGSIDPAYTKVQNIIQVLEDLKTEADTKAEDVMVTRIIKLQKTQLLKDVVRKMKEYGISQLPVVEGDTVIGLVSEADIINKVFEGDDTSALTVQDVMEEAPPVVPGTTPLKLIMDLLRFSPLVVIADGGKIKGVVAKADVIRNLSRTL